MSSSKDYEGNIWVKSYLSNKRDYPIGTKFKNIFGSYWVLTERGFNFPDDDLIFSNTLYVTD